MKENNKQNDIPKFCQFSELQKYAKQYGRYKSIAHMYSVGKKQLIELINVVNEDFSIEYMQTHMNDIRTKYTKEIIAYHDQLHKKEEERRKAAEEAYIKKMAKAKKQLKHDVDFGKFDFDDYDDYYDYDDDYYAREEAKYKNFDLVDKYESFKDKMCNGIGQRRVKLFLNKCIKNDDMVALLYKTALEVENANINAKKYHNTSKVSYQDNLYYEKEQLLKSLLSYCAAYNEENSENPIIYGYQSTDNYSTNYIVYFELPDMEQISFHCNLSKKELCGYPDYNKEWDGKVNSTIFKIEDSIMNRYKEQLDEYQQKLNNKK